MLPLGSASARDVVSTEDERASLSSEVKRLEGEVGTHAHHPLLHLPVFEQLKQRNVFRVAVLYLVVCWLVLDPLHVIFHMLDVPIWANRLVVILMAVGFPAVVIFAWVYEITPEGLKPTVEVPHSQSIRKLTGRRLDRAIIAVLAVALTYFVVDKFWISRHVAPPEAVSSATPETAARAATAPVTAATFAPPPHSIAVLPFLDMSEKKDQDYFSDGLAEELLDLLSQVPDLSVAARTSSFYFKGKSEDLATIAQKLHVAHILEGSVRKAGDRIRVTVQLIRAENGYSLWSNTYDRRLEDIFKVQDEIAAAVVEVLKARLSPTQRVVNQHRTDNLDAYAQYLLGNQLYARDTTDSTQQALLAYRRAVGLDPGYAAGYSGLAVSEWRVADLTTGEVAAYQRAAAAADKAIALAPVSPDGYWARGTVRYLNSFDWTGAKADFEKALTLDSNDVRTLVTYGRLQATLKRIPEAVALTRRALAFDPLSAEAWDWMGYYFLSSGQLAAARDAVARRGSTDPSYNGTDVMIDLIAGEPRAALPMAQRGYREIAFFGAALAEHSLGHAAESQRALDVLIRDRANTWAYQIAEIYAWRGEGDKAFEWLERAYRQQDTGLTRLAIDPLLKSLHDDRRFKALLRRMNLPE
jgi:TolB-like protein